MLEADIDKSRGKIDEVTREINRIRRIRRRTRQNSRDYRELSVRVK